MDKITIRLGIIVIGMVLVVMTMMVTSCEIERCKFYENKKVREEDWYDSRGYKKVSTMSGHKWVKEEGEDGE